MECLDDMKKELKKKKNPKRKLSILYFEMVFLFGFCSSL